MDDGPASLVESAGSCGGELHGSDGEAVLESEGCGRSVGPPGWPVVRLTGDITRSAVADAVDAVSSVGIPVVLVRAGSVGALSRIGAALGVVARAGAVGALSSAALGVGARDGASWTLLATTSAGAAPSLSTRFTGALSLIHI